MSAAWFRATRKTLLPHFFVSQTFFDIRFLYEFLLKAYVLRSTQYQETTLFFVGFTQGQGGVVLLEWHSRHVYPKQLLFRLFVSLILRNMVTPPFFSRYRWMSSSRRKYRTGLEYIRSWGEYGITCDTFDGRLVIMSHHHFL